MTLYQQRYLLHAKDVLTVPQLKPAVRPGTKLALTRVFEVGTHDFALKAAAGSRLTGVKVEATVLEHTTSPMTFKHLKKRRKGYKKEIRSKMRYTRLRIGEIVVEGTGQAEDLKPAERKLNRPVSKPYDQYSPTDMSIRGRLARQFGVVDYEHHRRE
jgi:ribosomal protein L21